MLTLKFCTDNGVRELRESIQVEGYVIERDLNTDEVSVYGLKNGHRVEGQFWKMTYVDGSKLRMSRGCLYVMNESGKTIDRYDVSNWPIFRDTSAKRSLTNRDRYEGKSLPLLRPLDNEFGLDRKEVA